MSEARKAIGAVQCEVCQHGAPIGHCLACHRSDVWNCECTTIAQEGRAHKATRGVNSAAGTSAGNAPTHFPPEPSGRSEEKLLAEISGRLEKCAVDRSVLRACEEELRVAVEKLEVKNFVALEFWWDDADRSWALARKGWEYHPMLVPDFAGIS